MYLNSQNSYYSTYSLFNSKPFGPAGLSTYYPTLNQDWVHKIQNNFSAISELFKDKMEILESSSAKFSRWSSDNVFKHKTVKSSNPSVAECVFFEESAKNKSYQIFVQNIATCQVNKGVYLSTAGTDSDNKQLLSGGKIRIVTDRRSFDLNIDIAEKSTNEQALTQIKDAINTFSAKNNLALSVNLHQKQSDIALMIQGLDTGYKFSFKDLEGNIVAATGINQIDIAAENANFSINNVKKSSQQNKIQFEAGKVMFELKSAGEASANVVVDCSKVVNAAVELAKDYNNLQSYLNDNPDKLRVTSLINKLRNIFRNKLSLVNDFPLDKIGVHIDSNHNIVIDREALTSATESNPENVNNLLSGISGVFGKINQAIKAAMAMSPGTYVDIAKVYTEVLWEKDKSFKSLFNGFGYNFMGYKAPYSNYLSKGNLMDFYF